MLQSTYDTDADAMYLRLSESAVARTTCIDDGTMVDEDDHGEIVGIELLRPARDWPMEEILDRYHVSEDDRLMLKAMFGDRMLRTVAPSYDVLGAADFVPC